MSIHINKDGAKKVNSIYANVNGEKKKIVSAYGHKDGQVVKLFGASIEEVIGGLLVCAEYSSSNACSSSNVTRWDAMTGLSEACRLVYGGDRFVVIGIYGRSFYSIDGKKWLEMTGLPSAIYTMLTYGNGQFMTYCSTDKGIYVSTDGMSWTLKCVLNELTYKNGINYLNGKFIVSGGISYNGKTVPALAISDDEGNTWRQMSYTTLQGAVTENAIYANGKYVFGKTGGVYYSTDLMSILSASFPSGSSLSVRGLVFDGSKFVAAVNTPGALYTSTDGIMWERINTNLGNVYFSDIIHVNERYYAVSSVGIYMSKNLTEWELVHSGKWDMIAYGQI